VVPRPINNVSPIFITKLKFIFLPLRLQSKKGIPVT
jgi:hypothetical protein